MSNPGRSDPPGCRGCVDNGSGNVDRESSGRSRRRSLLGTIIRARHSRLVIATARKIAVLLYNTLRHGQKHEDPGAMCCEERCRQRVVTNLRRRAASSGYVLHSTPASVDSSPYRPRFATEPDRPAAISCRQPMSGDVRGCPHRVSASVPVTPGMSSCRVKFVVVSYSALHRKAGERR